MGAIYKAAYGTLSRRVLYHDDSADNILYQDRNKKLLPDVINQYLACYVVVCVLITACTSIDTMVPYINKWYIAQKK